MFQSKIFSYKFNSFHDEERREGALGLKITDIEEEMGDEELVPAPRTETRRKFGRVDSAPVVEGSENRGEAPTRRRSDENLPSDGIHEPAPFERQDSAVSTLSTLSTFSEVDLDEFYIEESPPGASSDDEEFDGFSLGADSFLMFDALVPDTSVSIVIIKQKTLNSQQLTRIYIIIYVNKNGDY